MALTTLTIYERLLEVLNDDNLLNAECRKLASDIQEKSIHLVTIVEALKPLITSNENERIKQSVHILSQILSNLSKSFLNGTELKLLLTFYTERLKGHYSVIPSTLTGILFLLQMENLSSESITKIFSEIFSHVHCQSLQRSERNTILLILNYMLYNRINELKNFENEFINGIMNAIDGERDPQNLLLLFELLPTFFKNFTLGHQTEDMFEIIACYFPVDYNPSEGDQSNVTRENLADALSNCLYAIPEFAEYCLPLIIEKIESNLKVAKMDSLKLLRDSVFTFGINGLKPLINELWISLKEAAMSSDPEIKSIALEAITTIMQVISIDEPTRNNVVERVIDDTKWTLSNVQLNSFWSSERILEAIAKADSKYCKKVLKFIIPLCLGQYLTKTPNGTNEKVIILKTLNNFLTIALEFDINIQSLPELSWTDIPTVLTKELNSTDNDIKIEAFNCFNAQRTFLNSIHRDTLYQKMCDYIEAKNDALNKTCLILLENFAKIYPKEILDVVTDRFSLETNNNTDIEVLKRRLEALSVIAKESTISHVIIPKLVEITTSMSDLNDVALNCLNKLLYLRNTNFDIHQFLYENGAIDKFISINVESSNDRLKLVSNICRSILRKLNIEEQQKIFKKHSDKLKGDLTDNNSALYFEALLIPLNETVISSIDVCTYFDKLTKLALHSNNSSIRLASCKLISVLIHKLSKTDFIEKHIVPVREHLINILKSDESLEIKRAAVIFHTWLTKSIVVGGILNLAEECINDQIDFLRHHEVGEIVAEEFRTLIVKNEDTLTKENGCRIMFLYRQRIFESLLIENVFDGAERRNFLIALTTALEEVPIELLFIHINTIIPILAESLTLSESKLLLPILRTLKLLLKENHVIFMEEAKTIISNILELVTHKEMRIRIAAIECLNHYCDYPSMAVYSFKPDVLDKLEITIDDHKRLVRKIAVITRSRWFLYEQPVL